MIKTDFVASYVDGSTRKLPGYSVAPGLVVHRAVTMKGEETSDWNVTHAGTGWRLCGSFPTRKQAVEAATEFAKLTDWNALKPVVGERTPALQALVVQVLHIRNRVLNGGPAFTPAIPEFTQTQGRFF